MSGKCNISVVYKLEWCHATKELGTIKWSKKKNVCVMFTNDIQQRLHLFIFMSLFGNLVNRKLDTRFILTTIDILKRFQTFGKLKLESMWLFGAIKAYLTTHVALLIFVLYPRAVVGKLSGPVPRTFHAVTTVGVKLKRNIFNISS